jgi:hemolysin activation/secretion protein
MALAKNLDSSEQFNITGDRGVKAYREAISSDNGWLVGAELNYALPSPADGFSHTLGAFYDIGGWSRAKPPYGLKSSDTLKDIGLSYTINYRDIVLRVRLVRGLGEYPSELRKESDTYVSTIMMMSF